ncbi:unnamed protein product [Didymodactylos carnosus]|uniref:Uncharacterized protein n=2 Tax=Didymodactylos carnosus TaxID=1234261 RepID=A0A8S2PSV4_9BILA|nr:unnamed protein product [Didymodactylos carnosus]CAF4060940.1 unnamed protein product [Didymodactylos carnosus]
MSVAVSATIKNSHNSNDLLNPIGLSDIQSSGRQSDELQNQLINSLSFQPQQSTREFVRKQLQNTINSRQKPDKDVQNKAGSPNPNTFSIQGNNNVSNPLSNNLEPNQKGAYFRNQLSNPRTQTCRQPKNSSVHTTVIQTSEKGLHEILYKIKIEKKITPKRLLGMDARSYNQNSSSSIALFIYDQK